MHVTHQEGGHDTKTLSAHAEHMLASRDPERNLELVLLPDPELMVGAGQVQLGEEARVQRLISKLVYVSKGLDGALRDGVYPAKILAKSPQVPVCLSCEEW